MFKVEVDYLGIPISKDGKGMKPEWTKIMIANLGRMMEWPSTRGVRELNTIPTSKRGSE